MGLKFIYNWVSKLEHCANHITIFTNCIRRYSDPTNACIRQISISLYIVSNHKIHIAYHKMMMTRPKNCISCWSKK